LEVPVASGEPFSTAQLADVERAIELATQQSGLQYATYVGDLPDGRVSAEEMLLAMPVPESSVLVAVDPNVRSVDVVTGREAQRWLTNDKCALAVLTMDSRFRVGDIAGGLHDGIVILGEQAMHPAALFTDEPD